MAHPYSEHRRNKVEHARVKHMLKDYATGGMVHSDEAEDKKLIRKMVKGAALKMDGGAVKARQDRPNRASGGRVKKANTTVNVIVSPKEGAPPPMPMAAPPMPRPPVPPPGGPVPGAVPAPPTGMAPGIRRHGGRTYATGGAVKSGPAWEEGRRAGTPVEHAPGKNDTKDLGRGKPITYATGGTVEAPKGKKGMSPHMPGGGRGGLARLEKAKRAEKHYAKAE